MYGVLVFELILNAKLFWRKISRCYLRSNRRVRVLCGTFVAFIVSTMSTVITKPLHKFVSRNSFFSFKNNHCVEFQMMEHGICDDEALGGTFYGEAITICILCVLQSLLFVHSVYHHWITRTDNKKKEKRPMHVVLHVLLLFLGLCHLLSAPLPPPHSIMHHDHDHHAKCG